MPGPALNRAEAAWEALSKPNPATSKKAQQVLQQFTGAHLNMCLAEPADLNASNTNKVCSPNQDGPRDLDNMHCGIPAPSTLGIDQSRGDGARSTESHDDAADSAANGSSEHSEFRTSQASVIRELNSLTDPSAAVRKRALVQLRRLMFREGKTEQLRKGTDALQFFVESQVLKPLLRRFADPSSACRELALELTLRLLDETPDAVLPLLPYVIPALAERLAHHNPADSASSLEPLASVSHSASTNTEAAATDSTGSGEISHQPATTNSESGNKIFNTRRKSTPNASMAGDASVKRRATGPVEDVEENRLLLAKLLRLVLAHSGKAISAYAADVATMLTSSIADPAPEVASELCGCCEAFAAQLGVRLRQVAKPMIAAVTPLLGAKRQKVRSAGLRAVRRLVACGGAEAILDLTGFRDPNLIPIKAFYEADIKTNWFALLSLDPTVAVRREFLATLGDWLLHLPERGDHETRLLPYVLSAFSDANPSVQSEAFDLMEQIGRLYERDKEAELKDVQFYLPEERGGEGSVEGLEYSHPFTRRPCLGARLVVRGCFNRLVLPLVAELRAWTAGTKEHAIDLLTTMLTYVEENATQHVQPILLAFLHAEDDRALCEKVQTCCRLLGTFVPPSAYLPVLLPRIQGHVGEADARGRAAAAALLARLVSAAPADGVRSVLPEITAALTEPELLDVQSGRLVEGLAGVMSAVVSKHDGSAGSDECGVSDGNAGSDGSAGSEWADELVPVLWVLLHLAATENAFRTSGEASCKALASLEALARFEGSPNLAALLSTHLESILALLAPAATWPKNSLDTRVFCLVRDHVDASCDERVAQSLAAIEEEAKLSSPAFESIRTRFEQGTLKG